MPNRDSGCAVAVLLLALLTSLLISSSFSVELQRLSGCSRTPLSFECGPRHLIAVHGATFSTENVTCGGGDGADNSSCQEDIRSSLNNRCGGHNMCTFNFSSDHWEGDCTEEDGAVTVDYACVPLDSVQRFCNSRVKGPDGYLASPGYPAFFPKLQNCTWNISADVGQTLLLSVVDIDLPHPRRQYGRRFCDDVLHVTDGDSNKLLSVCGQHPPDTVESSGDRVTVYFQSRNFTPFRGFLLYYRVRGCPTLPSPKLGYMVYRNGSSALYMCCEGHLFNDTLENYRPLHCIDGFHWNATIPHTCLSVAELRESGNLTSYLFDLALDNVTHDRSHPRVYRIESNYLADIVIPSVLMAGLIIGNAVVFFIIIRIRKSQKHVDEACEEPKPSTSQEAPFSNI